VEQRPLGNSGLLVSEFAFGTMTFGGTGTLAAVGSTGLAEAERIVSRCIEAGITLFDTADVYSAGLSEELLGKALRARRRQVLIATKVFGRMGDRAHDVGLSRQHIVEACEASLKRLGTDHIDLYQAHSFDSLTPVEETLRAFDDLIRAGKVRYIGCSNHGGWQLMKALAAADAGGLTRYVSQQIYYSAYDRDVEWDLVPLGLDQGVGMLVYSPLAMGLLSGRYRRDAPAPADSRATLIRVPQDRDRARLFDLVDVLAEIADGRGVSVAQVALNWARQRPGVSSLLIGARDERQLEDNLAAATWVLSPEEMARIDIESAQASPYPYWHQQFRSSERNPYYRSMRAPKPRGEEA